MSTRNTLAAKRRRWAERTLSAARWSSCSTCRTRIAAGAVHCTTCELGYDNPWADKAR